MAPGPSGSLRVAASERVDERDDPGPVAQQHLQPDLVQQRADAVEDLGRVDRGATRRLDLGVASRRRARPPASRRRSAPRPPGGSAAGRRRGVVAPAPRRRTAGAALPPTGSGALADGIDALARPTRPSRRPRPSRAQPQTTRSQPTSGRPIAARSSGLILAMLSRASRAIRTWTSSDRTCAMRSAVCSAWVRESTHSPSHASTLAKTSRNERRKRSSLECSASSSGSHAMIRPVAASQQSNPGSISTSGRSPAGQVRLRGSRPSARAEVAVRGDDLGQRQDPRARPEAAVGDLRVDAPQGGRQGDPQRRLGLCDRRRRWPGPGARMAPGWSSIARAPGRAS